MNYFLTLSLLLVLILVLLFVAMLIKRRSKPLISGRGEKIKHIELLDYYTLTKDHPIVMFKNNDYIIGHIAGLAGSGKTHLGEKLQAKFPDIIVKDLDDFTDMFPMDESRPIKVKHAMLDFVNDNKGIPILFVGYNWEYDTFINIPGNKYFITLNAEKLAEQRTERSIKMGLEINEDDCIRKTDKAERLYYQKRGYSLNVYDGIFADLSRYVIPNYIYKTRNPVSDIIHINGFSGTGKTTLVNKLKSLGHNAIDTDDIFDLVSPSLPGEERDRLIREMLMEKLKICRIYIGLTIPMQGLADYTYLITADYKILYRRLNKRHIEMLCSGKNDIIHRLESNDLVRAWDEIGVAHKQRGPILPPPEQFEFEVNEFNDIWTNNGYIKKSVDDIIREINML